MNTHMIRYTIYVYTHVYHDDVVLRKDTSIHGVFFRRCTDAPTSVSITCCML